jgi:hypothetical protein
MSRKKAQKDSKIGHKKAQKATKARWLKSDFLPNLFFCFVTFVPFCG